MSKSIRKVQEKGVKILSWASFGFAVVAGAAASGTFLGDAVRTMCSITPGWVPVVALAGLAVTTAIDLFIDLEPNRPALWSVLVMPSLATATPGRLGDTLTDAANGAMDWSDQILVEWLGIQSAVGLTIACAVTALILASRVVRPGRG